uniref:Major facilitator superfamily (MFS) profile domain-containing protein n=1 Tax=Cyclopterus lumpus TaxID=8103 RepID=A0A8C3G3J6_CYCLU
MTMQDYEDSVAFLGQWGRFQQVVFFLLCSSILPNGFGGFSVVFLTDAPRHHCLVPEVNLTQDWSNEGCVDGWSYSRDVYQSTIVSEFDLVCREQWKQPFTSTVFLLGVLVGSFFSGQLSDRFGRKPVFFGTMALQTIFSFFQLFSTSWIVFAILAFINGIGQISNYVAAFVLGNEILTGDVRVLFSSLGVCLGFSIGYMMLPLFAYFLRGWKSLLLAISLPGLLYIPLWWFIPESPRWLLSQGRVEEAESIVRKAAKWNKVQAPLVIFEDYDIHVGLPKLKSCKTRHRTHCVLKETFPLKPLCCLYLPRFTLSLGYYGLSLNTSQLHANPYISCFLSAAVEVPANISVWLALRYFPRRLSVISILLVGGLSLYFLQLVPESLSELAVALEMVGKFAMTAGTSLNFAYTAELYPTVLRNTATGTCSAFSRVGSSLCTMASSPFTGAYFKFLPYIVMGTLAVVSAFAVLFLPESLGRPLPQTIQQMHERERWVP